MVWFLESFLVKQTPCWLICLCRGCLCSVSLLRGASSYSVVCDCSIPCSYSLAFCSIAELEDLTVLKRSPDLLNNVKIGQDQLLLIMKPILFYGGYGHFG